MSAIRESLSLKVRKIPRVRFTPSRILMMVAAAFFALTATMGTASASVTGAQSSFAAQARGYGLTGAQISTLQREVNTYIARNGGKQVAINEVAFKGGSTVFVVPGQKYAHPATSARPDTGPGEICPYTAFCTFSAASFEGNESEFYACNTWFNNNYNGSWKNDQTPGTVATLRIFNKGKRSTYRTCAAYCNNAHWNTSAAIYQVEPCT